ncbi:unnamed protein product, partial [marine sediment metagenome]
DDFDHNVRVVAIDKRGKTHTSARSSGASAGKINQTRGLFAGLKRNNIDRFEFQFHDYEWVEIPGLPAHPRQNDKTQASNSGSGQEDDGVTDTSARKHRALDGNSEVADGDKPAESEQIRVADGNRTIDDRSNRKRAKGHSEDSTLRFARTLVKTAHADTLRSLSGIKLKVRYWRKNKHYQAWYTTDDRGIAELELPTNRDLSWVAIESHPDELVPVFYSWKSANRNIEPPKELTIRFQPGRTVGGIVKDQDGAPIVGASVEVSLRAA